MATINLNLFGTFELSIDGVPLRLRTRKAMALVAYMAVERRLHSRDSLADLLWPASDPIHGRGMLRSTLAWVRRAFAVPDLPGPFLTQGQQVGLNPRLPLRLDLERMTIVPAEPEGDAGSPRYRLSLLRHAADCYRGDFMAGFSLPDAPDFEAWMVRQAEAWHQRQERVLLQLTQGSLDAGDLDEALRAASRWVAHAPLNEAAHQARIQVYLARGDRAAAHRALAYCRATLQAELGLEPTPETLALLDDESLRSAAARRIPLLRVRPTPARYLPVPMA